MSDEPELITLAKFSFAHQAEMARVALENAGIQCAVFDENQAGLMIGALVPVRIAVFEPDVEKAREVLRREGLSEES